MRSFAPIAALLLWACATPPAQNAEFLAPARAGAVECYTPDLVARTCRAISTYRFEADGRVINEAAVLLQTDPTVIMFANSAVTVGDRTVCGRVTRSELDAARFEIDGVRAPPDAERDLRDALWPIYESLGELCAHYERQGDRVSVRVFQGGVELPDYAETMIWVRPEDGFVIGAAEGAPI